MEPTRLGLIGCGWAASDLYEPAFRFLTRGRLVAVMDVDGARADRVREKYGAARVSTSLAGLLADDEIEAVVVLSPPHHHREAVVAAAQAGKAVYCEKPMAPTLQDADVMIATCKEHGVPLMIAFMKRFNRSFRQAKELIEEGRLGGVFEMRARWDNARVFPMGPDQYRLSAASGGGFLQEDGSHPLDICRWWLGDVESVFAHALIGAPDRHATDDVACVFLKHRSGAISTLHITMLTHATGEESYEVFGTHGTLVLRWPYHSSRTAEAGFVHLYQKSSTVTDLTLPSSWNPLQELRDHWQYLQELEHFCACVREGSRPEVAGEDGRAVVEIITAAYLSAWRGEPVSLPLQETPDLKEFFDRLRKQSPWSLGEESWGSWY